MDYNALSAKELITLCLKGDTQAINRITELFTPQSDADYDNAIAFESATIICEELLKMPDDFWNDKQEAFNAFFNSPYLGNYLITGEQNENPSALFGLAVLTCKNIKAGTCADLQDAGQKLVDYLHRAMKLNHIGAYLVYASLMYDSENEEERLLGVKAAEKAIELGGYDACSIPAHYYCFENVVPDKALKYAAICEEYEPSFANVCYSEIYRTGMCGKKDLTKAVEYLERSLASDSSGDTLVCILDCYIEMGEEERAKIPNFNEVVNKRIDEMLNTTNEKGWRILGIIYENGLFGYEKDISLAADCYKKACEADLNDEFSLKHYRALTSGKAQKGNASKPSSPSNEVQTEGLTESEKAYEKKKEKSITVVSYLAIALAIVFRIAVNYIPWETLASEIEQFNVMLELGTPSVFKYSYVIALMLFSILRVRRGKKGFIIGIVLSVLLGIFDIEYSHLELGLPMGIELAPGIPLNLVLLAFSIGLSLLLFFIFGKKKSMRKSGWYLLCCFSSGFLVIGLFSAAFLIVIAIICVIYAICLHVMGGMCCSSSSSDDYTYSSYSSQAQDSSSDYTYNGYSSQAQNFANDNNTTALYNEDGSWYVMDSYGNRSRAEVSHTGDIYNTYVTGSNGKTYVVPHSDVYSSEIYAATEIDDD